MILEEGQHRKQDRALKKSSKNVVSLETSFSAIPQGHWSGHCPHSSSYLEARGGLLYPCPSVSGHSPHEFSSMNITYDLNKSRSGGEVGAQTH